LGPDCYGKPASIILIVIGFLLPYFTGGDWPLGVYIVDVFTDCFTSS